MRNGRTDGWMDGWRELETAREWGADFIDFNCRRHVCDTHTQFAKSGFIAIASRRRRRSQVNAPLHFRCVLPRLPCDTLISLALGSRLSLCLSLVSLSLLLILTLPFLSALQICWLSYSTAYVLYVPVCVYTHTGTELHGGGWLESALTFCSVLISPANNWWMAPSIQPI